MSESTDTMAAQAPRRKFWTEHMERSYELLQSMTRDPAEECGEGFAAIPDAAEEAGIEMLFSTSKPLGIESAACGGRKSDMIGFKLVCHRSGQNRGKFTPCRIALLSRGTPW